MESLRDIRRARSHSSLSRIILSVWALASAGGQKSISRAQQSVCGATTTTTTPIRVENATGALALGAAVNCTGGGLVEAVWAGAVTLDAPISVGAGTFLSIAGEDASAEARGGLEIRMFEVAPLGGLNLTQVKLSGGTAANGGAIYSDAATLTLNGCVFDGNAATAGYGGAVWATGGNLTIIGGEFSGNTATVNGGAVFADDANLVVRESSRFEGNQAIEGGALYCTGAESVALGPTTSCLLTEAEFVSNNASRDTVIDFDDYETPWVTLDGGGAAAFKFAEVTIKDSLFSLNNAQLSGGALFGGSYTDMSINGCEFRNNTTPGYGAAVVASSATLGGSTTLANNSAERSGGAVFGWDTTGTIELNEVILTENVAASNGGCFYVSGGGIVNDGTIMQGNVAQKGGCIYALSGSNMTFYGGEFTECRCTSNGAFMFASDGARVNFTAGLVEKNVAERRGAAIYCSGDSFDLGGSMVTIEGGTFTNNEALEVGGALAAWGSSTVVTIKGGVFRNNDAKFYGGFIFLEEEASLLCEGATIEGNYAGDQGGGIYARESKWVNSSCDLIGNESPQGAAAYLTYVKGATFENHDVTDNLASGGSVVYMAESSVVARGVTFVTGVGLQNDSSNRAIQLEGPSTLFAEECFFDGWLGDTVIYNNNPEVSSLVLESCDFSASSATTVAVSPYSDAEVRNAVVGDRTLENAVKLNGSVLLVDRALDCEDQDACGAGVCVDSALGVLCECLEGGSCLDGDGALSLGLKTRAETVTYSPDLVSFELVVSAAGNETTHIIWELAFEADELALEVIPSSGILPSGMSVTVAVTGSPLEQDVGGNLTSRFVITSVGGGGSSDSAAGVELEVGSMFYLCEAFAYAMPLSGTDTGVECEQCATIDGAEGVDCDLPGATLASLPVRAGYWRSSQETLMVRSCLHAEACSGATEVSSSDDYCEDGYKGPYCAVCTDGYGAGVGHSCHACDTARARLLIFLGSLFSLMLLLLLLLAAVFLVGGLDAVDMVRQSVSRTFYSSSKAAPICPPPPSGSATLHAVHEASTSGRVMLPDGNWGVDYRGGQSTISPAFDVHSEVGGWSAKGQGGWEEKTDASRNRVWPVDFSEGAVVAEGTPARSPYTAYGSGVGLMDVTNSNSPRNTGIPSDRNARPWVVASGAAAVGAKGGPVEVAGGGSGGGESRCCGLGDRIKRWLARLPLDKLKILVVVWQILTVFPSITGVDFPPSYARFLSWIAVVNLNIGDIFSASCVMPSITFYERLLVTTLLPLVLAGVLVLTYQLAMRRAGIGSAGMVARRAAWSRHMAAGLLLTFLVFTSASTAAFKTLACDEKAAEGESYLRADYSLSCNSDTHTYFEVYAILMIVVYPIGIPLLYAFILWTNRESLNPRIKTADTGFESEVVEGGSVGADSERESGGQAAKGKKASKGQAKVVLTPQELRELDEKVIKRRENPDLIPSMFLWKDFGPDLYYYEVIECGRRILLTGVLIFIAPHSAAQAAMACIFAFASLLGFELLRPHLDPADSWLYRLGCVVIFLSNFLALLIKVEAAGEGKRSALGGLLVAINVLLVLAVLFASWFATQQTVDDSRDDENVIALAQTMLTNEQRAANSAKLTREGRSVVQPLPPSSTGSRPPRPRPVSGGRLSGTSRGRQEGSSRSSSVRSVASGEGAVSGTAVARDETVSAATVEGLWQLSKTEPAPAR